MLEALPKKASIGQIQLNEGISIHGRAKCKLMILIERKKNLSVQYLYNDIFFRQKIAQL